MTITTSYKRVDGVLHAAFSANGSAFFALEQLDTLRVAIECAKRHLAATKYESTPISTPEEEYAKQLLQMVPVPT